MSPCEIFIAMVVFTIMASVTLQITREDKLKEIVFSLILINFLAILTIVIFAVYH